MDTEQIKKTLDSGSGQALKTYLILRLDELKSIDNIKDKDVATHQAIEVKAQKRAYLKLKEILEDIMTFNESVKVKDKRDSYGISDEDIK
jgi:hypothetical protein